MVRLFCCLLGCCLFIPIAGWSQSTYEKGYFIDLNNQKTACFIKPEAWSARGSLTYLFSYKDQPQTRPLAEISEVVIDGVFNLKRANVMIDISGDESPLISYTPEPELYDDSITEETKYSIITWWVKYQKRLKAEKLTHEERKLKMNAVNPKYVLRNFMAEMAIDNAEKENFELIYTFYNMLKRPYDEQPQYEKWFAKRPDWAREKVGCSMLSCSS